MCGANSEQTGIVISTAMPAVCKTVSEELLDKIISLHLNM
jgi:hypothetical protein